MEPSKLLPVSIPLRQALLPVLERVSRGPWLALVFLCLAAAALRLHRLALPPFVNDEAYSWRITQYPSHALVGRTCGDANPPGYYLLLQVWADVWGTSPIALRSLSALLGSASVVLAYFLCRQAIGVASRRPDLLQLSQAGALFGAIVIALHAGQVAAGRTARMYALGLFFAALTGWLLCHALRSRAPLRWWLGYGIGAAAFCYTHYYAFFTLFAQGLFVLLVALGRWRTAGWRDAADTAWGFLVAAGLAFILYAPWLAVFLSQLEDVRQEFWIQPLTWEVAERLCLSWATGLDVEPDMPARLWLGAVLAVAIWTVWRAPWAGSFFLLQAAIPWLLALAVSSAGGRPILVARYLVFAQLGLLCLWGVAWSCVAGWPGRLLLTSLLAVPILLGCVRAFVRFPDRPPALAYAGAFLKEIYRAGDLVVTDSAAGVNRLRYYAFQAGLTAPDVRCRLSPFLGRGHVIHLASLPLEDIIWTGREREILGGRRLWQASEDETGPGPPFVENMRRVFCRTFRGGSDTRYTLALYEPAEPAK